MPREKQSRKRSTLLSKLSRKKSESGSVSRSVRDSEIGAVKAAAKKAKKARGFTEDDGATEHFVLLFKALRSVGLANKLLEHMDARVEREATANLRDSLRLEVGRLSLNLSFWELGNHRCSAGCGREADPFHPELLCLVCGSGAGLRRV